MHLTTSATTALLLTSSISFVDAMPALAADVYTRKVSDPVGGGDGSYQFTPPPGFSATNKPLKTHLVEVNFVSETAPSGYQYGITVDPIRLDNLRQFGTPDEVAAKVAMAEVNRDGVFDVKLMQDAQTIGDNDDNMVLLNYKSSGKRGEKRFVCVLAVKDHKLYAVTAQCKEDDYSSVEKEMIATVKSFQVL